jgi:transposase
MGRRHELTDDEWTKLEPLLPPQQPPIGKPNRPHRTVLNGMFWRIRTGAPWPGALWALPERYGTWQTVYARFRRWHHAGVWDRILAALQADADARGDLDWSLHVLDGTVIRAHPHAAGAKKGAAIRPWDGAKAASRPNSTCAARGTATRSPGC